MALVFSFYEIIVFIVQQIKLITLWRFAYMNVVVCIKQVPDTTEVKIDPNTNTLVRSGVPSIMNPFDKYAVELALSLKDNYDNVNVTVLSMGPAQAEEVLKEAICMGADKAVLLSDRAFAGADTLATSYTLAAAIRTLGPADIILCGKQAIDGDTAQVGPEIAENLALPQVTYVEDIQLGKDNTAIVTRNCEEYKQRLKITGAFVATVNKTAQEPRLGSIRGKLTALNMTVPVLTVNDLTLEDDKIGLSGSPTQVCKIFTPKTVKIQNEIIQDQTPAIAVDMLMEKLIGAKIVCK